MHALRRTPLPSAPSQRGGRPRKRTGGRGRIITCGKNRNRYSNTHGGAGDATQAAGGPGERASCKGRHGGQRNARATGRDARGDTAGSGRGRRNAGGETPRSRANCKGKSGGERGRRNTPGKRASCKGRARRPAASPIPAHARQQALRPIPRQKARRRQMSERTPAKASLWYRAVASMLARTPSMPSRKRGQKGSFRHPKQMRKSACARRGATYAQYKPNHAWQGPTHPNADRRALDKGRRTLGAGRLMLREG